MNVATTVAITTAAAASANSANDTARREAECRDFMQGYEHDTATVAEGQTYANCMDLLHPQDQTGGIIVLGFLAAVVVGILVAAWRA